LYHAALYYTILYYTVPHSLDAMLAERRLPFDIRISMLKRDMQVIAYYILYYTRLQ